VRRYRYCVIGIVGLIGPTKSACNRSSGLDVLIGWPLLVAGGLVAFPVSQASHNGFSVIFGNSGRVLRVSYEMCPYLS